MSSHERFEEWTHRSKRQIFMWPYAQISRLRAEIAALEAKVTEQAAEIARLREAISILSLALEASLRWSYEETREIASGEKSLDNTFSDKYVNDIELIRSGLSVTKRGLR